MSGAERFGAGIVGVLCLLALFGPLLPLADPLATNVRMAMEPPSLRFPFGTDPLGRDLLARVVAATRLDLGLAVLAVAAALAGGSVIGALAGWFGGAADGLSSWLVDLLLALPVYLLAMVLAGIAGNSLAVVVLVTALINLPFYIRLVRTEVRRRRHAPWADAARMGGMGDAGLLFGLILPGILPLLVVQATTNLGWAMLNAAGLSFIGIGVRPPAAEWGLLVVEGVRYLGSGGWWLVLFPGMTLAMAVLGFHLLGDGLRARLEARG